jgi:hypothetical protein
MTIALRRSSVAAAAILFLASAPVEAAGPLALLAKQIVKQMVQDYVQSQLTSFVMGSGDPCKPMGLAGTVAGMPAMSMAPAMPAQVSQLMPSPSAMASTPEMQQMDPAMRAQMMQMMAGMQSAPPLSSAEVDELVTRFAALSKAFPDQALPCSQEELTAMFAAPASMPMVSGSMRMMLEQFRAMEQKAREAEESFAKMSSAEKAEAMDAMLAELASLDAEERRQFVAVLDSDLTGIPASMRAELRARLAQTR